MKSGNKFRRYVWFIRSKLLVVIGLPAVGIILGALLLYHAFFSYFGTSILHLHIIFIALIIVLPVVPLIRLYWNKGENKRFIQWLSEHKYSLWFPFHFPHVPEPVPAKEINLEVINAALRSCDVVLRRQEKYLDGLIFSETSYFTHAGICFREPGEATAKIIHATSKSGVEMVSLEQFCATDALVILRCSFPFTEDEKLVWNYINRSKPVLYEGDDLRDRELKIFDEVMAFQKETPVNTWIGNEKLFEEKYAPVIQARAVSLIETPYDMLFDFNDFSSLSCIEFVWYCFMPMFPGHKIKVRDFEFLRLLNVPVIVPDVFVKNPYFEFVYSSSPKIKTKERLIKHVSRLRKQLFRFTLSIVIWEFLLLVACFFFRYFRHGF